MINGDGDHLIGQFGIGLFSAFMLADRLVVESRREDCDGRNSLGSRAGDQYSRFHPAIERTSGTSVRLPPSETAVSFDGRESAEPLEAAIRRVRRLPEQSRSI
jgi:HSP90 family molecular chaperone